MDHQAFAQLLGNYGEFVGAIAVVVTLGYLAIQIRQNTRASRVSAELECLKLLTDWVGRISASKDVQRLWDLVADGSEPISPEDSRQYVWLIGEFCWIAQTAFIQYRRGFLSEEAWVEFERMLVGFLQDDLTKESWKNRETPYSTEFISHIDRVRNAVPGWRPRIIARES